MTCSSKDTERKRVHHTCLFQSFVPSQMALPLRNVPLSLPVTSPASVLICMTSSLCSVPSLEGCYNGVRKELGDRGVRHIVVHVVHSKLGTVSITGARSCKPGTLAICSILSLSLSTSNFPYYFHSLFHPLSPFSFPVFLLPFSRPVCLSYESRSQELPGS